MKRLSILVFALFLALPSFAQSDEEGVYNAVLDYVEGFYNAEPERFDKSLSKDLVKYGYWMNPDGAYQGSPMNFEQANNWHPAGTCTTSGESMRTPRRKSW